MEAEELQGWKSCRGNRAVWARDEVTTVAMLLKDALPEKAVSLLAEKKWRGGPLLMMKDKISWRTEALDVKTNAVLLQVLAKRYQNNIPSSFFLTDVFMQLDADLNNALLLPYGTLTTKLEVALSEAGKFKKCMQHLRAMFRDTGYKPVSHCPIIRNLKSLLVKRSVAAASEDDNADNFGDGAQELGGCAPQESGEPADDGDLEDNTEVADTYSSQDGESDLEGTGQQQQRQRQQQQQQQQQQGE